MADTFGRLQSESALAALTKPLRLPPRRPAAGHRVLVLAAELNGVFTWREQAALARAYGGEAIMVEGSGHDVMLESEAADVLIDWVHGLNAGTKGGRW